MSRNVWEYGRPLLDASGDAVWSSYWSPALSLLLSPLGALPFDAAVVAERGVIVLAGCAFVTLVYVWLRTVAGVSVPMASLVTVAAAATPPTVATGSVIMADVPAAAAVLGALLLLRAGYVPQAVAAACLAYSLRTVNLVVVLALLLWIARNRPRREFAKAGTVAALWVGVWTSVQVANGGGGGYLSLIRKRDLEDPEAGVLGFAALARRTAENAFHLAVGDNGGWLGGAFQSETLVEHFRLGLRLAFAALLVLAVVGAVRSRFTPELLILGATLSVVVVWPWEPSRFLIQAAPLVLGMAAAGVARSGRVVVAAGVAAFTLLIASDVQQYIALVPPRAAEASRVAHLRAAYDWVGRAPNVDRVVALNDIQTFLYSGRPTSRTVHEFAPGRTLVVVAPYGGASGVDLSGRLARQFSGPVVYRAPTITVLRPNFYRGESATRRPPSSSQAGKDVGRDRLLVAGLGAERELLAEAPHAPLERERDRVHRLLEAGPRLLVVACAREQVAGEIERLGRPQQLVVCVGEAQLDRAWKHLVAPGVEPTAPARSRGERSAAPGRS